MRSKTLKELFINIKTEETALPFIRIRGVHHDSRQIKAGDLFVAIRGFKTDGHRYLEQVQQAQAAAAVVEEVNPALHLPQIRVKDSRLALAWLAANFERPEIDRLKLIGITGTNGKTTTAFLMRSILEAAAMPSGLLGTVAYYYGNKEVPAWNTTPEAPVVCGILAELVRQKHPACILEVSAHALSLRRVDGLRFDTAIFTNLSRDHMDFYQTEEAYFKAKRRLFSLLKENGTAVVNADDPYGRRLIQTADFKMITFGFAHQAQVRPVKWRSSPQGTDLTLQTPLGNIEMHSALIGRYNVENILAAAAGALGLGIETAAIANGVQRLKKVAGRLESYLLKNNVLAVIDYAHTPDALAKALQTLKKIGTGRLVVLFGAGGDRDKGKRPLMGQAAEKYADRIIVTSDNPRSENPERIIADILSGMTHPEKREVISDRREAIRFAVQSAQAGDCILIAGKGHELYQEINGIKRHFNEVQILKEASAHV